MRTPTGPAACAAGAFAALLALGLVMALLAGCSSETGVRSSSGPKAAPLRIVTALYPLAQAADQIGQGAAAVSDVVPPGDDPLTYRPGPAQLSQIRSAGLVLDVGGGFQAAFEAAARDAGHVYSLTSDLGATAAWAWLDPADMMKAVDAIGEAMELADPAAAGTFRQGTADFSDLVQSTGVDFESTLSACPRTTIATADTAFAKMAAAYGLNDLVLGAVAQPTTSEVTEAAGKLGSAELTTAFEEPWVPSDLVVSAAKQAHLSVATLDTLVGPPAQGWPTGASYIALLENDLGVLNSALGCPGPSEG